MVTMRRSLRALGRGVALRIVRSRRSTSAASCATTVAISLRGVASAKAGRVRAGVHAGRSNSGCQIAAYSV